MNIKFFQHIIDTDWDWDAYIRGPVGDQRKEKYWPKYRKLSDRYITPTDFIRYVLTGKRP